SSTSETFSVLTPVYSPVSCMFEHPIFVPPTLMNWGPLAICLKPLLAPGPGSHSNSPTCFALRPMQFARENWPVLVASLTQRPSSGSAADALLAATAPDAHT